MGNLGKPKWPAQPITVRRDLTTCSWHGALAMPKPVDGRRVRRSPPGPRTAQSAIRHCLLQRVVVAISASSATGAKHPHALAFLGTILGPHVMRDGERPARLCTPCTATSRPSAAADLRKCVAATYWGSSGRRFKSCQPDTGQRGFSPLRRHTPWGCMRQQMRQQGFASLPQP